MMRKVAGQTDKPGTLLRRATCHSPFILLQDDSGSLPLGIGAMPEKMQFPVPALSAAARAALSPTTGKDPPRVERGAVTGHMIQGQCQTPHHADERPFGEIAVPL